MSKEELKCKAAKLAEKYSKDICSEDLVQEMNHITMVHNANFGRKQLGLRSTMSQDRLKNLARLSIESDIAKQIDFDTVIRSFAKKKARKATLFY